MNRLSLYQWAWIFAFLSFCLRLPGFFADLPPYLFVDEAIYTNGAYSIALSSWGWAPYNYLAGGLNYYIPAIVVSILHFFHIHFDMTRFVLVSRIIGPGILSCLSIPLLFTIGRMLFKNEILALLAAGILAFSPLMLSISRIWYPDHYAVIFSVLALYAACKIATEEQSILKYYMLLGVAIGLSASTKYNGFFFIFLIPIAQGLRVLQESSFKKRIQFFFFSKGPWVSLLAMLITIFIANPYVVSRWNNYLIAIKGTIEVYKAGSPGLMVANAWIFYSMLLLFTTFGILGGFTILLGSIAVWFRTKKEAILLIVMPIIFIALMGRYKNALDRNVSVIIPYMALLFAVGFGVFQKYFSKKVLFFILCVIALEPMIRIMLNVIHDFLPDSREIATKWVNDNLPAHSVIGSGVAVYNKSQGLPIDEKKYNVTLLFPFLSEVHTQCVNYFILDQWTYHMFGEGSSVFSSPFFSENNFRNIGGYFFKKEKENIDKWLSNFNEIHRVSGFYYGPEIRIYERKTLCPMKKSES